MDKILELLIKYFEDKVEIIDICKKEKINDKYKFICIYKVYKYVYITLFIFFIL
jgi:hypothetical protein